MGGETLGEQALALKGTRPDDQFRHGGEGSEGIFGHLPVLSHR
jgi:hypothetical protein